MAGERLKNALKKYRVRYQKAARNERTQLLTEFCKMTGYHRKYAISLLSGRRPDILGHRAWCSCFPYGCRGHGATFEESLPRSKQRY